MELGVRGVVLRTVVAWCDGRWYYSCVQQGWHLPRHNHDVHLKQGRGVRTGVRDSVTDSEAVANASTDTCTTYPGTDTSANTANIASHPCTYAETANAITDTCPAKATAAPAGGPELGPKAR